MKGTIRERKKADGGVSYLCQVPAGRDPATGKRRFKTGVAPFIRQLDLTSGTANLRVNPTCPQPKMLERSPDRSKPTTPDNGVLPSHDQIEVKSYLLDAIDNSSGSASEAWPLFPCLQFLKHSSFNGHRLMGEKIKSDPNPISNRPLWYRQFNWRAYQHLTR